MIANARANVVMLYHKTVSKATLETVHRAGGRVFTWTVDDAAQLRRLRNWGVDGIASNHPELFAALV